MKTSDVSKIFAALSSETRIKILLEVMQNPNQIMNKVAKSIHSSLPNVSTQIKLLHAYGIIDIKKVGKYKYLSINEREYADIIQLILRLKNKDEGE